MPQPREMCWLESFFWYAPPLEREPARLKQSRHHLHLARQFVEPFEERVLRQDERDVERRERPDRRHGRTKGGTMRDLGGITLMRA